jgi:hypothetical protein
MVIEGKCHCGNLSFRMETQLSAKELVPRECDCSFCRSHGAKCLSDPSGSATIYVDDASLLQRYRFGLQTADFLVCGRCGVYLGAVISSGDECRTTLNLRATGFHDWPATVISYDGETTEGRVGRRMQKWTPAKIVIDRSPNQSLQSGAASSRR